MMIKIDINFHDFEDNDYMMIKIAHTESRLTVETVTRRMKVVSTREHLII